jgi:N-methylhydantoinase A
MGGTSTDVALCDGALTRTTESEIAGLPLRQPMIDIHTVGAGGGSCAWLDEGGALRVGPKSMGADPGPACYGAQAPPYTATVTDAHAVLETLPASRPLSGGLMLDQAAAAAALERVSDACDLDLRDTAAGILRVVETTMARAIQRISVERGHDPRDFTLVPFGGAGGLHAAHLADQLGLETILVPTHPGLLSAWGMLGTAPLHTFSLGLMLRLDQANAQRKGLLAQPDVEQAIARLTAQADQAMAREGVLPAERIYAAAADMRYLGQSYELTVPLGPGNPVELFTKRHAQLYGYVAPDKPLEVTAVRLEATCAAPPIQPPTLPLRDGPLPTALLEVLPSNEAEVSAPTMFVERSDLLQGDVLDGPAIVGEYSATTLVPAGWRLRVNELGQLVLRRANETGGARGRA